MNGYSIFNHAQFGHVDPAPRTLPQPAPVQPVSLYVETGRCPYCDGTGDVHTPTGEWRGACTCPAGQQPQAQQPRPRVARGWAVDLELGLGPAFSKRRRG